VQHRQWLRRRDVCLENGEPEELLKTCHFDCFAGASGDMILGALLDAGIDRSVVDGAVSRLGVSGWSLEVDATIKGGLRATQVKVHTQQQHESRSPADIEKLIDDSTLTARAKELAQSAFRTLGRAEAAVHGVQLDEVHFHEVGALDAIVDIVGSCAAFAHLSPEHTTVSSLPLGSGSVETRHGTLPVPVPAVTEIFSRASVPVHAGGTGEAVTPTGAALLVTFADAFGPPEPMTLEATGYGAGQRDTELPNVVRLLVGDSRSGEQRDPNTAEAFLIETNIDDLSPELVSHACDRLLVSGAADAWVTPITMKKGRSAFTLSALVAPDRRDQILEVMFEETSTLGVRLAPVAKEMLERDFVTVEVQGQVVRVKLGIRRGRIVNRAPEYEDARAAARALGLPLKEVYELALQRARAEHLER
jgi:pyridinium-3,5-bisthiocarboxylic acid mononucleotide nickel chelatase